MLQLDNLKKIAPKWPVLAPAGWDLYDSFPRRSWACWMGNQPNITFQWLKHLEIVAGLSFRDFCYALHIWACPGHPYLWSLPTLWYLCILLYTYIRASCSILHVYVIGSLCTRMINLQHLRSSNIKWSPSITVTTFRTTLLLHSKISNNIYMTVPTQLKLYMKVVWYKATSHNLYLNYQRHSFYTNCW